MQRFDDVAAAAQGLMVLMEFGLWLSLLQNVDGKVQFPNITAQSDYREMRAIQTTLIELKE